METVTLIGAEDVRRAASTMRGAAEEMTRAANTVYEALFQHQRFMEDWLVRFEAALEKQQEKAD